MVKDDRPKLIAYVLKPCPFCGADVTDYEAECTKGFTRRLRVTCTKCLSQVVIFGNCYATDDKVIYKESAIEKWNTRAGDDNG